ncbi:hypothetical protein [Streptomyces roseoviridis]|uniref:Integral membrane protein n=1 Tax=Streptomyces roseoviridis TaxID=67361 RepID=A0ABV5QPD6_9ACTN
MNNPLTVPVPRPSAADSRRPRTAGFQPPPALLWPAALAALFTLLQLALVVPGSGLGWDEAVYVSQVGGNAPPAFFSAPRARGITYLVAPVAALTASTTAIRVYLALLSGAALFGALWAWRRTLPAPVLTAAGALFTGLWITLFYGPRVMPNLWCAFGALAAVGCFLTAVTTRAVTTTGGSGEGTRGGTPPRVRAALAGLGATVCAVALLRPSEGLWLALPLLAAALLVPAWRRRRAVFPVLVAAPLLGALPWIAEAYAHYGGLAARLRRAGEIQGSLGWYWSVDDHVRALAGRTLCRPCDVPWQHPVTALWWFVLPVAVAAGIAAARRAGRGAPAVLATVTALSLAAPYLFTVGYAAPRFLLPAYALLALPAAEALIALVRKVVRARRPAALGLLTGLLLGHLAVQYTVLAGAVAHSRSARAHFTSIASALHGAGVRPPCLVSGKEYVPVGYYTGCTSRAVGGHDAAITPGGITAAARRMPVAVLVPAGAAPPAHARGWRPVRLPAGPGWDRYDAYVSPGAGR